MEYQFFPSLHSTNTYLKEHRADFPSETMLIALEQTAGRGQRGNSWEAEAGKNLTFSFHFTPEGIAPGHQFVISEAVALAMVDLLETYGIKALVKWPNDIYVGDRKICGILIENSIMGSSISNCIVGVGLNVNQTRFVSDAPNPVSMAMLAENCAAPDLSIDTDVHASSIDSGADIFNLEEIASKLCDIFDHSLRLLSNPAAHAAIHQKYLSTLWRADGLYHPFLDTASGQIFEARILDIEPDGHLLLQPSTPSSSSPLRYAFKEVSFLLPA